MSPHLTAWFALRESIHATAGKDLKNTECKLLELLLRRTGRVVSHNSIIEAFRGFEEDVVANTVDAFVSLLRRKLEAGGDPRLIPTVRGYGYILREEA